LISSESIEQLSTALALAQGELEDAAKDKKNPHFNSRYADITGVLQAIRPVFSKHGLSVVQGLSTATDLSAVTVTTRLCHKSGQWIQDALTLPVPKKDAQGIGNASTYGRRYGLAAMAALGQEDDDGNSVAVPKGEKALAKKVEINLDDLKAAFEAAKTKDDISKLVPAFTKLPPQMQTELQPYAAEARKRAGL
jgi:hypothetical protein